MKKKIIAAIVLSAALINPSFASDNSERAIVGAIIGSAIGAAIGDNTNGRNGAILGSAIGAATGTAIATRNGHRIQTVQAPTVIEHRHVNYYEERPRHRHHYDRGHRGHNKHKYHKRHRDHHYDDHD